MYIYVINLRRSADRRKQMVAELQKVGARYEIVDAVDGREIDLSDSQVVDPAVVGLFPVGAFGCVLSHLKAYRRMLESGYDAALILEDDVILPTDLAALTAGIRQRMAGAEVALLNFHSYEARFTRQGSVDLPGGRALVQIVDEGTPWSGAAYVISREACERMVRYALPVRARADAWAHFYRQGVVDRVRCVVPMPVANNVWLRTTKDNFLPGTVWARALETIATGKVPVVYQALALRRQRHLRRYRNGQVDYIEERRGDRAVSLLTRTSPVDSEARSA